MSSKLDLWLWGMPLQNREFRNKTNENWKKIMDWADKQGIAYIDLYNYINAQFDAERQYTDTEMRSEANKRRTSDEELNNQFSEMIDDLARRIDNIVIDSGDSNKEVLDARIDAHGVLYDLLKSRLDKNQLDSEKKSTNRFAVNDSVTMQKQDIAYLENGEVSGKDTVVWLNASSEDDQSFIAIETQKEVVEETITDGLVLAKIGVDERYAKRRTGILKQMRPFCITKDNYVHIFCYGAVSKMVLYKVNEKGEDEQIQIAGWSDGYKSYYVKGKITDLNTHYKLKAIAENNDILATLSVVVK